MEIKLVSKTMPIIDGLLDSEDLVTYTARISNPSNQKDIKNAPELLKYLIDHEHWSPFEHVSVTFEITTSRAIAAQINRHRSFAFQEFSQRYSKITNLESFNARRQSAANIQSSEEFLQLPDEIVENIKQHLIDSVSYYELLLKEGVSKECARMVLPMCTQTTLYMTGTLRSWIHYVNLRTKPDTQLEHREIAEAIKEQLFHEYPNIGKALGWYENVPEENFEMCNHPSGDCGEHVQHFITEQ